MAGRSVKRPKAEPRAAFFVRTVYPFSGLRGTAEHGPRRLHSTRSCRERRCLAVRSHQTRDRVSLPICLPRRPCHAAPPFPAPLSPVLVRGTLGLQGTQPFPSTAQRKRGSNRAT